MVGRVSIIPGLRFSRLLDKKSLSHNSSGSPRRPALQSPGIVFAVATPNHRLSAIEMRFVKPRLPIGVDANFLIRFVVGGVFLNEGILKLLDPVANAVGRFAAIGIPDPEFFGPMVAIVETFCGFMLIVGLFSRFVAFALFIDISVAIWSTKIPVLLGHSYLGFALMKVNSYGFLSMVHEARTDLAMWFGLWFLLVAGPGGWSLDARRGVALKDNDS